MIRLDGSKLVRLRMKKRWKQSEAAAHAGVSLPTYSRAESGKSIQPLKADLIVRVFKSNIDELEKANEGTGDAA